jgi:outer membrane protein assembly factor BamB
MVYAWMGTGQLVALTMDGKPVWSKHIGRDYAPFEIRWGHGSSPVLYDDKLLLLCDHTDAAYLLALDKLTGKELWKVDRGSGRSYMTPHVVRADSGDELVISSTERIDAYDPNSGKLLWHSDEPVRVPVASPVLHDGVLYASRGYRSGPYLALRTGGRGDVTATHTKWRVRTGAPYISSLLYYQGLIYMSTEAGVAACVDASTGKSLWKQRLGGYFSASPVAADGKVYLTNEEGQTFVLAAGGEYRLLAENDIGERTLASPAIAKGRILLRTDEHLIAIGGAPH